MRWKTPAVVLLLFSVAGCTTSKTIVLDENGGWCWCQ
jgi:hypothetical protein